MKRICEFLQSKKNPNEEIRRTLYESKFFCTTEMLSYTYWWHSVHGVSSQNGILREFP